MRLIDADEVERNLNELWEKADDVNSIGFCELMDAIDDAPTVDAEPVKHGKWNGKGEIFYENWTCSVCGNERRKATSSNYCSSCGARMDGE